MFGNNRIKKINYRIKIQKFITTDKNLKENEMNKSLFIDWKAREPRWTPRQRVSNYRLATSTSKEREISLLNSAFNTLLLWCGTTLLIDFPWVAKNSLLFSFQKYFKKKNKIFIFKSWQNIEYEKVIETFLLKMNDSYSIWDNIKESNFVQAPRRDHVEQLILSRGHTTQVNSGGRTESSPSSLSNLQEVLTHHNVTIIS